MRPRRRETTLGKARRRAACPLSQTSWARFAMRTHAFFTHPTIQPLRKLQPPGTIWRTACGAQRLHSLANTARLILRPPTRRAGPRAGRRLKSHLSLRLYQRKSLPTLAGVARQLGSLGEHARWESGFDSPWRGHNFPSRSARIHTHRLRKVYFGLYQSI